MTTSEAYYDDDGFDADYIYQVKSVNPGWPLLVFTIGYGLAAVYFIPILVFIQRRNEWYKKLKTKVRRTRKNLRERREKAAAEREAAKMSTCMTVNSLEDATPYILGTEDEAKEVPEAKHSRKVVRKGLKKGRRGRQTTPAKRALKTKGRFIANDDASVDSYSSVAKSLFLGIDEGRMKAHKATRGRHTNGLPIISEGGTPPEQHMQNHAMILRLKSTVPAHRWKRLPPIKTRQSKLCRSTTYLMSG